MEDITSPPCVIAEGGLAVTGVALVDVGRCRSLLSLVIWFSLVVIVGGHGRLLGAGVDALVDCLSLVVYSC